ncbi:hypothetical protein NQZ68_030134 [Dissostichus eleginoides]|nr:hypothetical protein NQZ68_030134 [Dissostichus eleginoides]
MHEVGEVQRSEPCIQYLRGGGVMMLMMRAVLDQVKFVDRLERETKEKRKKNKQSIHKFSLCNEPRLRPTNHRAVNGGASPEP